MGIGDWGLGIGDWGLGPIPNPQSPLNSNILIKIYNFNLINLYIKIIIFLDQNILVINYFLIFKEKLKNINK